MSADRKPDPQLGGAREEMIHERASATPQRCETTRSARTPRASVDSGPAVRASLRELQSWFAQVVMHPDSVEAGIASTAHAAERVVTPSSQLSVQERLGVYHYAYREHALERIRHGDYRAKVVEQAIAQEFLGECGVVLFLTMIMQRMRPKYQDRSYRYGLLEAGHLGENAYLAATSMGLGACGVGAFMDDQINEMLGVDGVEEAAVYMLAAGRVAAAA